MIADNDIIRAAFVASIGSYPCMYINYVVYHDLACM